MSTHTHDDESTKILRAKLRRQQAMITGLRRELDRREHELDRLRHELDRLERGVYR